MVKLLIHYCLKEPLFLPIPENLFHPQKRQEMEDSFSEVSSDDEVRRCGVLGAVAFGWQSHEMEKQWDNQLWFIIGL